MIFPEILAEMRRPRDFIKGMAMAQSLIFVCYLMCESSCERLKRPKTDISTRIRRCFCLHLPGTIHASLGIPG
jgi:hypothetical protein